MAATLSSALRKSQLSAHAARLRGVGTAWRGPILAGVGAGFALALVWSISALDLDWRALDGWALGLAAALTFPACAVNAAEFQLCGRAAGVSIGFRRALAASNWATLSNLLPLPGSLVVRSAALARAGAGLKATGTVVVAAAALWASLSLGLAFAAAAEGWELMGLAILCLVGSGLVLAWIAGAAGRAVAGGFLAVRLGLVGLTVLRLWCCFAAIGHTVGLKEATVYSASSLAGAVVGIVPAGLGITEAAAAALALVLGASPAAAFLALSLNRIIGLAATGLILLADRSVPDRQD